MIDKIKCWFLHKWDYADPKMFRQCERCFKKQYRVYTDSGIKSIWFNLS